jgi:hypothetical protein
MANHDYGIWDRAENLKARLLNNRVRTQADKERFLGIYDEL